MSIDRHVSRRPAQALSLSVRNMLLRLWVAVLFRHAEVDNPDCVCAFGTASTNEEIVWLDISVNEVLFVDCLNASELFERNLTSDNAEASAFDEPFVLQS